MTTQTYIDWLSEHLEAAKERYKELCRLDDLEEASGTGANVHYVEAQQMFGYVAALEKCQREARSLAKPLPRKKTKATKTTKKKKTRSKR